MMIDDNAQILRVEFFESRLTVNDPRRATVISNGIWRKRELFADPVIRIRLVRKNELIIPTACDAALYPFGIEKNEGDEKWSFFVAERGIVLATRSGFGLEMRLDKRWFKQSGHDWKRAVPITEDGFRGVAIEARKTFALCLMADDYEESSRSFAVGSHGRFPTCVLGLGETISEACEAAKKLTHDAIRIGKEKRRRYFNCLNHACQWTIPSLPEIQSMMNQIPAFVRQLAVKAGKEQIVFKAAGQGYGYYGGWDGGFSAWVSLLNGDAENVGKYLNFLHNSRAPNGSISPVWNYDFSISKEGNYRSPKKDKKPGEKWEVCHDAWGVALLEKYDACHKDDEMLGNWWPALRKTFSTICAQADADGLVRSSYVGPDYPVQAGRKEKPLKSTKFNSGLTGCSDMGVLYDAIKSLIRLAERRKDRKLSSSARKIESDIRRTFASIFINRDTGWLYDCVDKDDLSCRHFIPCLWQLMSLHGEGLFLSFEHLNTLADYLTKNLSHSNLGFKNIADGYESMSPNASMPHNHWQNFFVETMRLLRWTMRKKQINRMLSVLRKDWKKCGVVHENLFDSEQKCFDKKFLWDSLGTWMGMTSSTWWRGTLIGLAGLEWHTGGLSYIPCRGTEDIHLKNLPLGRGGINVSIRNSGEYVDSIIQDGVELFGTWQTLSTGKKKSELIINRGNCEPTTPILVMAANTKLLSSSIQNNTPVWHLDVHGPANIVFFTTSSFTLVGNDREIPLNRMKNSNYFHGVVTGKGRVDLTTEDTEARRKREEKLTTD